MSRARERRRVTGDTTRLRRLQRRDRRVYPVPALTREQAHSHLTKRAADILLSGWLLAVSSPLLAAAVVMGALAGPNWLLRKPRIGRRHRVYHQYALALPLHRAGRLLTALSIDRVPVLFNILRGEMSFVGPRPLCPEEAHSPTAVHSQRFLMRPGLICLWWLRQRGNIDYGQEWEVDEEYSATRSLSGDFGIILRALAVAAYGRRPLRLDRRIMLFGVPISNLTMSDAIAEICARLRTGGTTQVCFLNAHCVNISSADPEYLEVLRAADLNFADGVGMRLAGKLLGHEIRQNINGTDLFPRLCSAIAGSGIRVFLLGGHPGVPETVRDWIHRYYPEVIVCGTHCGYFGSDENQAVVAKHHRGQVRSAAGGTRCAPPRHLDPE